MKEFKKLEEVSVIEEKLNKKWQEMDLLNKTIENRNNSENFVFYDGPATANSFPKVHHMLPKVLKDVFCKYNTMQGKRVIRKAGWDTHGLPVELEVEKELGFKSKTDIESYGIAEFNEKCRASVWKNEKAFSEFTEKMGQLIDTKNAYVTYDNNYIETEWWILEQFFNQNLFYEGYKVTPYCPRCGTALASHEVAQGYENISVDTVYVPFKLVNEDCYFLVWTTTPWTLLANVALCINPKEEYVKIISNGTKYILAHDLVSSIFTDYEILETYKGSELEHIKYEQLLPFINPEQEAFYVTNDTYVTMDSGTGIVHIAPAFGADDYNVAKNYNLPVINPVGEDGRYITGPWQEQLVFDADKEIIEYLKENGKLFKKQRINHDYPHCWRCHNPLLYYAKPSYYLKVTALKDQIIANNDKVNWYPAFVGEKRFGNWLLNMNDWAISRSRYWGTPLPLWKCSCGHTEMIGSRAELINKAIEDIDMSIDLHRPAVDNVHIKCSKCGNIMTRCKDVIDCWFDSGSMPFAQYHYPFENKELFDSQFPADFISEGIDQTRGWFYTLLVISTFVKGVSPYKNVLVNDLLLDKNGKKMSKSLGNGIDPFMLMDKYGADLVRFYLLYVSPVWTPLKFSEDGLKEVHSKFVNPLKNTYNFFALYAKTDNIDITKCDVSYELREEIDKWLLSKYNNLVKTVTDNFNEYDLNKVVRNITNFVSEDLSNWYIRRNRDRFWQNDFDTSKKSVYITTYEVLLSLSKLIAPVIPYLSEELYLNLTDRESVHLEDYPKVNEEYINNEIEEKMDLVRTLISIGRGVREEAKIKVRQPLSLVFIDIKNKDIIADLTHLIEEELNVKEVKFIKNIDDYMTFTIKPNYKVAGKIFGGEIKLFVDYLNSLSTEDISKIYTDDNYEDNVKINNQKYLITKDMLDIRFTNKVGFNTGMLGSNFIIINTEITDDLKTEGLAREFVSKVQNIRKTENYDVSDRIIIHYNNKEFTSIIDKHFDYISRETLATDFILDEKITNNLVINEIHLGVVINKK